MFNQSPIIIYKFCFIFLIATCLFGCDKQSDHIEKTGKVVNLFSKEGEPDVEVCALSSKNCILTDKNGNYNLSVQSNDDLSNDNYSFQKDNFIFEFDYFTSKTVAVPRTWVKLNIKPWPGFEMRHIFIDAMPLIIPPTKIESTYSQVVEIDYSLRHFHMNDNEWWKDYSIFLEYTDGVKQYYSSFEVTLVPLDTVDINFN